MKNRCEHALVTWKNDMEGNNFLGLCLSPRCEYEVMCNYNEYKTVIHKHGNPIMYHGKLVYKLIHKKRR